MAKRRAAERKVRTVTVADAVSEAFGEFMSLGEEMRTWAENLEEKFSATDKYSRISEAADNLENLSEVEAIKWATNTTMEVVDPPMRKRAYSRPDRCSHACNLLDDAINACENRLDDLKEGDDAKAEADEVESYRNELIDAKDEAEAIEFPGMYG